MIRYGVSQVIFSTIRLAVFNIPDADIIHIILSVRACRDLGLQKQYPVVDCDCVGDVDVVAGDGRGSVFRAEVAGCKLVLIFVGVCWGKEDVSVTRCHGGAGEPDERLTKWSIGTFYGTSRCCSTIAVFWKLHGIESFVIIFRCC